MRGPTQCHFLASPIEVFARYTSIDLGWCQMSSKWFMARFIRLAKNHIKIRVSIHFSSVLGAVGSNLRREWRLGGDAGAERWRFFLGSENPTFTPFYMDGFGVPPFQETSIIYIYTSCVWCMYIYIYRYIYTHVLCTHIHTHLSIYIYI